MLDVDQRVISNQELIARVEQLVQEVTAKTAHPDDTPRAHVPPPAGVGHHVAAMHTLQPLISPPDLSGATGLRGKASLSVKKLVRRLTSWYVEPRWVMQQQFDGHVAGFAANLHDDVQELTKRELRSRLQTVAAIERVNRMRTEQDRFVRVVDESLAAAASQHEFDSLRKQLAAVLARLGSASATAPNIDYVSFEDRFRGAGTEVAATQQYYVDKFGSPEDSGKIVDIGCGRGEMLELLAQAGHEVIGVDLDEDMVNVCVSKGLPAVRDDSNHFLERVADSSLRGIFCAQVVEHLFTSELELFVRLAQAKLRPGGVLIVETINPRSLYAVNNHFLADVSHIRPVHPETLRFICEQVGFSAVALEERSPHPMLSTAANLPDDTVGQAVEALLSNVFGYQDYAIIATK